VASRGGGFAGIGGGAIREEASEELSTNSLRGFIGVSFGSAIVLGGDRSFSTTLGAPKVSGGAIPARESSFQEQ
jgi:hypothetical protein